MTRALRRERDRYLRQTRAGPPGLGHTDLTLPLWPRNCPRPCALAVSHRCTHWSPEAVSILASACQRTLSSFAC